MTKANFISSYRASGIQLLQVLATMRDLELQYNAEALGSALADGDFTGSNGDLTAATFVAAVGSREAIESLLSANGNGHYTNLMKLRL